MTELAGVMVGNYFLLECLGHEGMVETYRARPTTRGGLDVVLRIFRPPFPDPTAFQEHFVSEVEKVWRCHHEHIQPLLAFGAGNELLFAVTEFAAEKTLEQDLERDESEEFFRSIPQIVHIITQLCAALNYAHEQRIVHGNIQPSSILIQRKQDILLTNFSMKHIYQAGDPLVAQIEEGNPSYMAPEQVVGMLTPASDIYAVGVLLYRLLTGHLPYDGQSAGEIALKHAHEAIPSLHQLRPDLPDSVELVVRVALAKSPEARFPSANALARALLSAIAFDSLPVVSVKPQRRIEVHSRRRTPFTWSRALSLLAILLILFGLIGTLQFFSSLPIHLQDIPDFPFHSDNPGSIAGTSLSKATPTAATVGITPSAPSPNGSNSTPQVHLTPTVGRSHTPIVEGTDIPTTLVNRTFFCTPGTLTLDSSRNLQPLLQQVDADFMIACPELTISLRGDGSHASLNELEHSRIDVAGSDLTANPSRHLTDHPIGALLYALVVSPDVELNGLSSAELQEIFYGQITNWAQIGGSDEAIRVILPPAGASVNAIFQTFVLKNVAGHEDTIRIVKDSPEMVAQSVLQTPGAISLEPLVIAQKTGVKILNIDGVAPDVQTLLQGTYTFWSVEHLYTQSDGSVPFQAYMQFFSSDLEQHVLSEFGFVPMNMLNQSVLDSHISEPVL
jgi:serine/threonine protein kinase